MHSVPATVESMEDITIERVDFDWIKSCVKVSYLRRAIRVIEADGDYYPELKAACFQRLEELDPSLKKQVFNNNISHSTKERLDKQLEEWQEEMKKNPLSTLPPVKYADTINAEDYFNKQATNKMSTQQRARLAQSDRSKGNQAMKSKDFDEAISFYTKSLSTQASAASYCNRALAFLKKNQYNKAIKDCTDCLGINPQYAKAFHRRSKAYLGLKNRVRSYLDLKEALQIEVSSKQLAGQMKQLKEQMTQAQLQEVESCAPKEFKRIPIEEDSQGEELEGLS